MSSRRRRRRRCQLETSTSRSSPSARARRGSSCRMLFGAEPSRWTSHRLTACEDGIPLVVPEVNGDRAREHEGIVANPNCCAIPLTMALKPLHDAAGLARVRVSTYQSVSGAGTQRMDELRGHAGRRRRPRAWTGTSTARSSTKSRSFETRRRKILELPELPISATCVRVPVLIGHAEAVWVETEEPLSADDARALLGHAPGIELRDFPTPRDATGIDEVLVGRIRRDPTAEHGLVLFVVARQPQEGRGSERDPDLRAPIAARSSHAVARPGR